MPVRMRLPEGCRGVVHAGRPLDVVDGVVTVPPEAAAALAAHGLEPVAEPVEPRQGAGRRPEPDRRPR